MNWMDRSEVERLEEARRAAKALRLNVEAQARVESERGVLQDVDDRIRALARGVPVVGGGMDEVSANLNTGFGWLGDYERELAYQRARDADFDARHPVESTAWQTGGAVAGTIAGLRFLPKGSAPVQASAGKKLLMGAGIGAGGGYVEGFMRGEGGFENRHETAKPFAVAGGVIGAAAPAVAKGVGAGYNAVASWLANRGIDAKSVKILLDRLKPEGVPPGRIRSHTDSDNDEGTALTAALASVPGRKVVKEVAKKAEALDELFDHNRLSEVPQHGLLRYVPPRGVPQRIIDLRANPDVRRGMLETIDRGLSMGGANWYNTEPLLEKFVEILGRHRGYEAFRKFIGYAAAASPKVRVAESVRNASYYYMRDVSGKGLPIVGATHPKPYGSPFQRRHQMNAHRVAAGGLNPITHPKTASFLENLSGNQTPVTIDMHAYKLPAILAQDPRFLVTAYKTGIKGAPRLNVRQAVESGQMQMSELRPAHWQAIPRKTEYGALEDYYTGLGRELGMPPSQTQASAWIGGGSLTGVASDGLKPFVEVVKDRVNKTAEAYGVPPDQIWRDFIRGRISLIALGGGAALTMGTANQSQPTTAGRE